MRVSVCVRFLPLLFLSSLSHSLSPLIVCVFCVHALSFLQNAIFSIGIAELHLKFPFSSEFSLIGLALIALGTGGIKPCVAAFGGDQFKLPEQERQLQVPIKYKLTDYAYLNLVIACASAAKDVFCITLS